MTSGPHRKHVLGDEVVAQGGDVNSVAVGGVAEVVGLGRQNFPCLGDYQTLDGLPPHGLCDLAVHRAGGYLPRVRYDAAL